MDALLESTAALPHAPVRESRRVRISLKALIALPLVVAMGLSVSLALAPPTPLRGKANIRLSIRVAGRENRPLAGARVRIVDAHDDRKSTEARTQRDGEATLVCDFDAFGERQPLRTSGFVSFDDHWLEIQAEGYQSLAVPLAYASGSRRELRKTHEAVIMSVALEEGRSAKRSIDALVGRYRWHSGGSSLELRLLPGGRYSRAESGSLSAYRDYGHAELVHDQLVFAPMPHGDSRAGDPRPKSLVPVAWGARRYLIEPGAIAAFCGAVNEGAEPRRTIQGCFLLREGDWNVEVNGLPEVPGEWRSRLLRAPLVGTIVERIGEHRARINLGRNDGVYDEMMFEVSTLARTMGHSRFRAVVVSLAPDSCLVEDELADLDPTLRARNQYPSFAVGQRASSRLGAR